MSPSILLVEDEEDISMMVRSVLVLEGYDVTTASDGAEGVRMFRNNPDFDLVLTDLRMPNLGGVEMLQKIRSMRPNVKVIAASGYEERPVIEQLKRDGLDAFIEKPFEVKVLLNTVKQVLSQ